MRQISWHSWTIWASPASGSSATMSAPTWPRRSPVLIRSASPACSSSTAHTLASAPAGRSPLHLKEIWYQSFHQKPWAAALIGSSREACRIYFGNQLRHWAAGNPAAFDGEVLEAWVDNFLKPGNLQGGFDWYISANAARLAAMRGEAPRLPPIAVPAVVRWGALDPVLKVEWIDRLGETFTDLDAAPLDGVGHFPHREDPDRAAAEITACFGGGPA
jgi:pimeloyl-ACP methyl ester carboxylesterase